MSIFVDERPCAVSALATFLRAELEKRGWRPYNLAIRSGVASSTLWNILNAEDVVPKRETLTRLARALELPPRILLEYAGYVIDESSSSEERLMRLSRLLDAMPRLGELAEKIAQLSSDEQDVALSLLEAHLALRRQRRLPPDQSTE
jgi:transcriptional regulator with XRE-family HTH domain